MAIRKHSSPKVKRVRGQQVEVERRVPPPPPPPPPALPFSPHAFSQTVEYLGRKPWVFLTLKARTHMWHFVDIAKDEVGWLGTVEQLITGDFLIKEVFLLKQKVSCAETEISEEGISFLSEWLLETRGDEDGLDAINALRFWGHSHVDFETKPSPQDEYQMNLFRENGCPWSIRGILNKKGRMEFDIFFWEKKVIVRDVPWSILEETNDADREEIEATFKVNVETAPRSAPVRSIYLGNRNAAPAFSTIARMVEGYGVDEEDEENDSSFGFHMSRAPRR